MEKHKEQDIKVAVVIPYFKLAFFEKTLQSLANQTDKRFNVYIGDDLSPESPTSLLEKFENQLNVSYHRFSENLGSKYLVKQWERCIDLISEEEWIMILGDDDYLEKTVIESWYKNYDTFNSKSNLVRFATQVVDYNINTFSEVYTHPVWESGVDSFWRKYKYRTRSSLSEYIFSKSTYTKFGFKSFPLAWNSDDCAWLDFSDQKPIYTINESSLFIGVSTLNISGKDDNSELKTKSQILFYKHLISHKAMLFNEKDRILLLRRYENEIARARPLTFSEWLYLFFKYLKHFKYSEFKKFFKRALNTILKRHDH